MQATKTTVVQSHQNWKRRRGVCTQAYIDLTDALSVPSQSSPRYLLLGFPRIWSLGIELSQMIQPFSRVCRWLYYSFLVPSWLASSLAHNFPIRSNPEPHGHGKVRGHKIVISVLIKTRTLIFRLTNTNRQNQMIYLRVLFVSTLSEAQMKTKRNLHCGIISTEELIISSGKKD